jgi:outer membrane protein OmpA-like peptidoglycan-associated protein
VDIHGTALMPEAGGRAKVTGHTGRLAIDAELRRLAPARKFGPEFLTFVLWAITPEGRAVNLGEVIPNDDGDANIQVSTALQEFGLIVTAEPYFAVTRPSDLVVAENIVRPDTKGFVHTISTKYDLLRRGEYTTLVSPAQLPATNADLKKVPLQLLEAQNAIAIAEAGGAQQYAPEPLARAREYMTRAQDYYQRKQGRTPIGTVARAAAQAAEDARLLTLQRKQQEAAAAEQRANEDKIARAQSEAEAQTARAEQSRLRAQRESEQRALAEQERQAAESARLQAEEAQKAAQQQLQEAEAARKAAQQQQQAYAQEAEQARLKAQQADEARSAAERQREELRARLLQQLNTVLQTRDTAEGLIATMPDVLFDTGRYTLKPTARERLAKVAGILLAYPDLRLKIEGFTDNVGSDDFNQRLSEKRAATVRDYLVQQGVPMDNVAALGMGKSNPVASNATAAGRQQNRRVDLIVSGESIQTLGQAPASGSPTRSLPASDVTPPPASAAPQSTPPPSRL